MHRVFAVIFTMLSVSLFETSHGFQVLGSEEGFLSTGLFLLILSPKEAASQYPIPLSCPSKLPDSSKANMEDATHISLSCCNSSFTHKGQELLLLLLAGNLHPGVLT